ncbi:hypothetical protein M011DRAFT_374293, partial [Sporormia fimetaria CBS 119925]
MPANKDRLYVALYARGGSSDTYHWALLVGPKEEVESGTGMRYHAKTKPDGTVKGKWYFDEREIPLEATQMLLVRVMITKIEKKDRVVSILRSTPVKQGVPTWTCKSWVQDALRNLEADGKALGTGVTDWDTVREAAIEYCQQKKAAHRFDGKVHWDTKKAATYDLLEKRE